jgi:hypothetical protein
MASMNMGRCVSQTIDLCDKKKSDINNLKEEEFMLAQDFRGYRPRSLGSIISRPVLRQNIMAEGMV